MQLVYAWDEKEETKSSTCKREVQHKPRKWESFYTKASKIILFLIPELDEQIDV